MKKYVIKREDGLYAGTEMEPCETWVGINDAHIFRFYDSTNVKLYAGETLIEVEVEIVKTVREIK